LKKTLVSENRLRGLIRESIAGQRLSLTRSTIYIGDQKIQVEVADTENLRNLGLMFRRRLPDNQGMLFIFENVSPRSFWMKNTFVPLSIAYADGQGKILNIEDMSPHSLDEVSSSGPAMYALEMPIGWFDQKGIHAGDRIQIFS